MQKIIVIGDTHCDFDMIQKIIERESTPDSEITAILHAGDLGLYDNDSLSRITKKEKHLLEKHKNPYHQFQDYIDGKKAFPVPLYGIPGNHEDFDLVQDFLEDKKIIKNLHLLKPGEVISLPFNNKEIKIAGLGKILPAGMYPKNPSKKIILKQDIEKTIQSTENHNLDILLLHEAPFLGKDGLQKFFGNYEITTLIKKIKPKIAFIGHMHFEYEIQLDAANIKGLGYGVRGKYLTLDEDLNTEFKSIDNKMNLLAKVVPETEEIYRSFLKYKTTNIIPRGKSLIYHFNLDSSVAGHLTKLTKHLKKLEEQGKIDSIEKSFKIAEKWLKDKNFLSSNQ